MKALILAIPALFAVAGFVVGTVVAGRKSPQDKWLQMQLRGTQARLARAEELIDDLGWMASDHQALGDPFGVLALEKIQKFHKVEREKGASE